jgi:hypothetical protein
VTCDGEDVTAAIRDPGITAAVKPIADSPECRAELVRMQQEVGRSGGLVTEGRDQGSVVFPHPRRHPRRPRGEAPAGTGRRPGGDPRLDRAAGRGGPGAEGGAARPASGGDPRGHVRLDRGGVEEVVARILDSIGTP